MNIPSVRFAKNHNEEFYKVLRQRVNDYFKSNNISRYANVNMVLKTIFMIALYFIPFILMLTVFENYWLIMLMWVLMGFGMAGIGLSVMHDANHGAYSRHEKINQIVGYVTIHIRILQVWMKISMLVSFCVFLHTKKDVLCTVFSIFMLGFCMV